MKRILEAWAVLLRSKAFCLRFLFYWKEVLETSFNNRMRQMFFGQWLHGFVGRNNRSSRPGSPQVLLHGDIERREMFLMCRNVIVDFDRCRLVGPKEEASFFEEGFIRIGDRVSPPSQTIFQLELDRWRRTCEPMPAATEFAPGKTALMFNYPRNISLVMRNLALFLHAFKSAGVPEGDDLLIHVRQESLFKESLKLHAKAWELAGKVFSAEQKSSGVFLFRRMIFLAPEAARTRSRGSARLWQTGDFSASLRRRTLTGFNVEPRGRVRDVGRITLISRQDSGQFCLDRKISNEDEIVLALRTRFPDTEITKVALERLSIREQVSLIHRTDVLIGMHGAGLGLCPILPPNAGVLELLPACFMFRHWASTFYWLIVHNQCHYQRWINLNPRREFSSAGKTQKWLRMKARSPRSRLEEFVPRRDFTEVPPSVVVCKVEVLRRQICKSAHCPT